MPHSRERYLAPQIVKALKHSPIVGILGHRQTGKTTLVNHLCSEYITLDIAEHLDAASTHPMLFLKNRPRAFCIDECQLAPALFPALKETVRQRKTPGQFLLTGSIRFTSRKAIRESLTGRLHQLELLPFTLEEAHAQPLGESWIHFLKSPTTTDFLHHRTNHFSKKHLNKLYYYMQTGGLPGICFLREESVRLNKIRSHLDTVLSRDLRLIHETSLPQSALIGLLRELASIQGESIDYAKLSRKVRISTKTLPILLESLQALFLIRFLETKGGVRKPVVYFEDPGIAHYLSPFDQTRSNAAQRIAYALFYPRVHYHPDLFTEKYRYLTRHGALVPLVLETRLGTLGIILSMEEYPTPSEIAAATRFTQQTKKAKVLILGPGRRPIDVSPKILIDALENWLEL